MEEQRNAVKAAFFLLREHFPGLPNELRDFQVESLACERLESLLASQSDAHRIAPHRDFHPTHPIPSIHPLIALKQKRPMM